jgi:hypothetical protein
MNLVTAPMPRVARAVGILLAFVFAVSLGTVQPARLVAAEPTASPGMVVSPEPTSSADAICQSAEHLQLIIQFLRDTDVSEEGWLPVLVGAIAGLSEARDLIGLVDETYRPLVSDLIVSLENLITTIDALDDMDTAGAKLAAIGQVLTDIGNAMDALSTQLQAGCPHDEPAASPSATTEGG